MFSWVWCSRIPSSGVQALAQDAENVGTKTIVYKEELINQDVFFNIMSLAFPVSNHKQYSV